MTIVNHEPLCIAADGNCICREIGAAFSAQYKRGWDDCGRYAAQQAEMRLSKKPQRTSVSAVRANLPRSGTKLAAIYALICKSGDGLTDFEIEEATGMAHQSASAARNVLMNRGLIKDAGVTRKNARGMDAIVWIQARPSSKEPDDRLADVVPLFADAAADSYYDSDSDHGDGSLFDFTGWDR